MLNSVLLAFCPKVFECFIFCRIKLHDRSDSHSGGIAKSFLKNFILCVLGKNLFLHLVCQGKLALQPRFP